VRQRVYAGDRESEVRIKLVGDAEGIRLNGDLENLPVAVVGEVGLLNLKRLEVGRCEGDFPKPLGIDPA
jgi:hypothetical protein